MSAIDIQRLGRVFGDRVLVKKLERPKTRGGLLVPAAYAKEQAKETDLWFGEVVALGLDARYPDAYKLAVGEVVGMDALGSHSAAFEGADGHTYVWVPEEFIACRDRGEVAAYYADQAFPGGNGLEPLGPYALVKPQPVEERRRGIVLPQTAAQTVRAGTVLAVSPGLVSGGELVELHVTVASEVLLGQYAGAWARLGRSEYLLVKEEDVIAELAPEKEVAGVGSR